MKDPKIMGLAQKMDSQEAANKILSSIQSDKKMADAFDKLMCGGVFGADVAKGMGCDPPPREYGWVCDVCHNT